MCLFVVISLLIRVFCGSSYGVVTVEYNTSKQCLSGNDYTTQKQAISLQVRERLNSLYGDSISCGCGRAQGWEWNLVDLPQLRGCGRRTFTTASRDSVYFNSTVLPYSRVCGRINAVQYGSTEAFYVSSSSFWMQFQNIESSYVVGVSLTHGSPGSRQHIWTFASSLNDGNGIATCPCSSDQNWPYEVYQFVKNNYFCETGNHGVSFPSSYYYYEDPLWDGKGCPSTSTCCSFNKPPWFCTTLSEPTSDPIEMRISLLYSGGEDVVVTLVEIYVQ